MRNIKLVLEYDGSRYQGWQRLGKDESTNTISNKIIEVIKKMTNEDVELFCGARTEVGVHAYGQVVNFKTTSDMTLLEMKRYLNRYLPMDIAVIEIDVMPERFHAQLNAKEKTYAGAVLKDNVEEWLKTAKPGDEYIIPRLKIGKRAAEKICAADERCGYDHQNKAVPFLFRSACEEL